jgi:hypothetical protein
MPKSKRPVDQPDAFVYRQEGGQLIRLCRHCVKATEIASNDEGVAYREAQLHLWSSHSKRFVWVDSSDPRHAAAVQMALPIVLAHNTTRHN